MIEDEELNRTQIKPLIDSCRNVSLFDLIDRYQYYAALTKQIYWHFISYFVVHVIISIIARVRTMSSNQDQQESIFWYFPEVVWLHLLLLFFGGFGDSQNIVRQIRIFRTQFKLDVFTYYAINFLTVFLCLQFINVLIRRSILLTIGDAIIGVLIFRSMLQLRNEIRAIEGMLAEMKDKRMYLINSFVYDKTNDPFEDKIQRVQKSNSQCLSAADKIRSSVYKFCHQETAEDCSGEYQQQPR